VNCEKSKECIMKYFDGELNDIEETQFREHLKNCISCSDEFNCMHAIFTTLDSQPEAEPPGNFEAMVMDRVNVIQEQKNCKSSRRVVLIYNMATLFSIVLLLFFVADLKQVSAFSAFEKLSDYFGSFSSATAAVFEIIQDIFRLLGDAILLVINVAFSVFKSYYFVFITLTAILLAIHQLLNYIGIQSGGEAK